MVDSHTKIISIKIKLMESKVRIETPLV